MGKSYVLFVDETGKSDIDSDTHFSLAGVICEHKYSVDMNRESKLTEKIRAYKNSCFGRDDLNIHLLDIVFGKKEFKSINRQARKNFINELHTLLKDINFTVISVTVNKDVLKEYYTPTKDPYSVAFSHLLQCFYSFISKNNVEKAKIVIEGIEDKADLYVQKTFFDVFNNGGVYLNINEQMQEKIHGFIVAKKGDKIYKSGLELVDIICNPLWRVKVGKKEFSSKLYVKPSIYEREYGTDNKLFNAIKDKIYTSTSIEDISNWGFKEIPMKENLELIRNKENLENEINEKNIIIEELKSQIEGMEKKIDESIKSGE